MIFSRRFWEFFTFKTVLSHQGFSKKLAYKMAYLRVIECRFPLILLGFSRVCSYHAVTQKMTFIMHFISLQIFISLFFIMHKFSRVKTHKSTPSLHRFWAIGILNGGLWQGFSPRQYLFLTSKTIRNAFLAFPMTVSSH